MKNPKVSIILPVYNVENYIQDSIESIKRQLCNDYEVLFVDDGSTDRSVYYIEQYIREDNRVKLFHQENKGSGAARNLGLQFSRGEFIYFMDPDDTMEPTLLKENIQLLFEYNADLVIFGNDKIKGNKKIRSKLFNGTVNIEEHDDFIDDFYKIYNKFNVLAVWNKIYRKSFLDKNNILFDDMKTGQDAMFNLKLFRHLNQIIINNKSYYHYRIRSNSARTNMNYEFAKNRLQCDMKIINKLKSYSERVYVNHMYINFSEFIANFSDPDAINYFKQNISFNKLSLKNKLKYLCFILKNRKIWKK